MIIKLINNTKTLFPFMGPSMIPFNSGNLKCYRKAKWKNKRVMAKCIHNKITIIKLGKIQLKAKSLYKILIKWMSNMI